MVGDDGIGVGVATGGGIFEYCSSERLAKVECLQNRVTITCVSKVFEAEIALFFWEVGW